MEYFNIKGNLFQVKIEGGYGNEWSYHNRKHFIGEVDYFSLTKENPNGTNCPIRNLCVQKTDVQKNQKNIDFWNS